MNTQLIKSFDIICLYISCINYHIIHELYITMTLYIQKKKVWYRFEVLWHNCGQIKLK